MKKINKNLSLDNKNSAKKISVIGSGAWGLAIASLLAKNGHLVTVLSRNNDLAKDLNQKYLQSQTSIKITTDQKNILDSDFIFLVVPSNSLLLVIQSLKKISPKTKLIICSKGISDGVNGKNLQLFNWHIEKELPKNKYAILSGPNFAKEVEESLPTTTTIASKQKTIANEIAVLLKNDNFLPIISNDIISAQIFGTIKNIIAIGCGIVDGLRLGENAKAALVVKGILEARLLIKQLGGNPEKSFISPAGLGDLFLTCSSKKSRNNTLGFMIGEGNKIADIIASKKTFEGFKASELITKFAKQHQINLPLCEKINQILQGNFTKTEIRKIIIKSTISGI